MSVNKDLIDESINKGLDYLSQHQYPNGQFCAYIAQDEAMKLGCYTDSTVFFATVIGSCLLPLSQTPAAESILSRLTDFLRYEMVRGGAWNYFSVTNRMRRILPYDGDSLS